MPGLCLQMIGDDQRGWAWTRALQGLPANEIHLCGDASALPLVQQMCKSMGETLTVCNYDRFTQLEIEPKSLPNSYGSVQAGDAIVAFSRRDIFDIKTMIERRTNLKCCVIYGALPPEMRPPFSMTPTAASMFLLPPMLLAWGSISISDE